MIPYIRILEFLKGGLFANLAKKFRASKKKSVIMCLERAGHCRPNSANTDHQNISSRSTLISSF